MNSLSFCSRPWSLNLSDNDSTDTRCLCWAPSPLKGADMALIEQGETAPEENCRRLVLLGSSKVGMKSFVVFL